MARQKARNNEALEYTLISDNGARCACLGQCGHNHNWHGTARAVRCAAPHGCNIVRQLDNPSCWRLATLQGFRTNRDVDMKGPRTHERGQYVVDGVELPEEFAYEELFDLERITQVWLSMVTLDPKKPTVFCQFCARHLRTLSEGVAV